jgi:DNA-directed RNA polymerase subunit RPC12/RpoP
MRPNESATGEEVYECFECGIRIEDPATGTCEECGSKLVNIGKARDL